MDAGRLTEARPGEHAHKQKKAAPRSNSGSRAESRHRMGNARDRPEKRRRSMRARDRPGTDYSVYRFSPVELLQYLGMYALLDGCISFLFFRSFPAFLLLLPGVVLFLVQMKASLVRKRKRELTRQFLDAIQLMLAALQAGYSPENALRESQKELRKIYSPDASIVREFHWMDAQMRMSRNLEELLLDFGRRSDLPDILSFAEVFLTAKRTGGDLIAIIRNTVSCIRQKQETMQEIETCMAGKVMEQNIMSLIPVFILVYVKLSSPEFLDVMYETPVGVAVMGVCFAVYLAAYFWGQSIVRIEV